MAAQGTTPLWLTQRAQSHAGIVVLVAGAACLSWVPVVRAEQSGVVPLKVDTVGRPAAAGTPVSNGVPFPMGAVATVDHLRLETSQGTLVPANYRTLASWPDGSLKAALVSFVPTAQGEAYPALALRYGPSVSHASPGVVTVTEDALAITVTTDALKLQFPKGRFSILDQAWTDVNSDGRFDAGEQWLSAPADLAVVDKKTGGTFRSSLWSAGDGYAPRLVEVGPQKVTVLLDGRLKGVQGALTADGDATIAQAKIWVSVYAGSTLLPVQTTLIDTKSRSTEQFSGKVMDLAGVALELPLVLADAGYAAGGEAGAVYQGQVGGGVQLLQDAEVSFAGTFSYSFNYSGVGSGAKAPGWMDVSAASRGVTVGLRHFWQTFPHKLAMTGAGLLQVGFVPVESSHSFWTVYPGVGKTYEAFVDLHAGGYTTTVRRRAELALTPAFLLADGSWYASSRAFGELSPPSSRTGYWESKMENQYRCTVLREGCSIYPQLYGQRDFGDYQAGVGTRATGEKFPEYGDGHYEDAHGFLLQFARTADRRWFDYAVTNARHHYDLDVMHAKNPVRYPGYPAGMIHWHGTSEHEGVNIELGHVVPGGLDEYYLLTGDPRAFEVIREQGDWVEHWARTGGGRIAPERSGDPIGLEEYERVGAWTLYTLLKSYEATGDPKYWEGASLLVKNTVDWWKMPQDHIVFDGRTLDLARPPQEQAVYFQRSDWAQGTGYPLPTLRVANCSQTTAPLQNYAYQTHAPIAWMSGLLQMALVRYYQNLERHGGVFDRTVMYRGQATAISLDTSLLREMLIQIINMVIEHNYMGAPTYPSKYPWLQNVSLNDFVYSVCPERDPRSTTGGQYLSYPVLVASSFNQQEVPARWLAQWPQLQAKWREIIQGQYVKLVVNKQWGDTSANGAGEVLSMPYAVARMEQLGLLDSLPQAPPPPPPSSGSTPSGGSGTTIPTLTSQPAYQVSVNEGGPFLLSRLIDLRIVAPSQATEVNVSGMGFGQGTWQQVVPEIHGFSLPQGVGSKTIYVQFRDAAGGLLASLVKSAVLLEPGFAGDVELVLDDAEDAYVFSNSPNENFARQPMVTAGKYDAGYDHIGLFRFAIPSLPTGLQATVKGAKLEVYLLENTRNTSQVISAFEATESWTEDAVTWNSRPGFSSTALGVGVTFTGRSEVNRWKAFSVAPTAIQRWLQDHSSMHGLAVLGQGTPNLTSIQVASSEFFYPSEDRRPKLVLQLGLSMSDATGPVIGGIQATGMTDRSATIQWTTNELADGLVEYGTTTGYGQTARGETSLSATHAVTLDALASGTLYHFRVVSKDAQGNESRSGDLTLTTTAGPLAGDLNRDGQVTLGDLTLLLSQLVGLSAVTPESADVNGDGHVSVGDLQALVNRL